ncbi:MAG: sulfotransferase family protein [Acidimicrobiia bacterium]
MSRPEVGSPLGVAVIGMHRSGTSAVTRVVNLVGVPLCNPRYLGGPSQANPTGHWENRALTPVNEAILNRLGGFWSAPPPLPPGWERDDRLTPLRGNAVATFHRTMPARQWLWKDPRLCLTLPFWRRSLPEPIFSVLVLRHPLEIADSLFARSRLSRPLALALWERYMRTALENLQGLPVLAVQYSDFVRDPMAWAATLSQELAAAGLMIPEPPPTQEIATFVDPGLWRARQKDALGDEATASPSQVALSEVLGQLAGFTPGFSPPSLPEPTPWAEWLLEERRASFPLREELGKLRRRSITQWMRRARQRARRR